MIGKIVRGTYTDNSTIILNVLGISSDERSVALQGDFYLPYHPKRKEERVWSRDGIIYLDRMKKLEIFDGDAAKALDPNYERKVTVTYVKKAT